MCETKYSSYIYGDFFLLSALHSNLTKPNLTLYHLTTFISCTLFAVGWQTTNFKTVIVHWFRPGLFLCSGIEEKSGWHEKRLESII